MGNRGGTCLERPKPKPKTKQVDTKPKPKPTNSYSKKTYTLNRDGHKAGDEVGKWRCKICKFMNDKDNVSCHMCNEEKTVLKEP